MWVVYDKSSLAIACYTDKISEVILAGNQKSLELPAMTINDFSMIDYRVTRQNEQIKITVNPELPEETRTRVASQLQDLIDSGKLDPGLVAS